MQKKEGPVQAHLEPEDRSLPNTQMVLDNVTVSSTGS